MHSSSAGKAGIGRGVGAGANVRPKQAVVRVETASLLTSHPTSTSAPTSLLIAPLARRHPSDDRARGDSGGGAPAAAPRWRRRPLVPRDAASPVLWCTFPRPALVSRGDGGSAEHYHVECVNSVGSLSLMMWGTRCRTGSRLSSALREGRGLLSGRTETESTSAPEMEDERRRPDDDGSGERGDVDVGISRGTTCSRSTTRSGVIVTSDNRSIVSRGHPLSVHRLKNRGDDTTISHRGGEMRA
jgi:hypothetical protein